MEKEIPVYLNRKQAAEMMKVSIHTLTSWAWQGRGPKFAKAGHRAIYKLDDVLAWLESRTKAA